MRKEIDFIGEKSIPENALYGIQSLRASENFSNSTVFHPEWFQSMGIVKLAMYETIKNFQRDVKAKYGDVPNLRVTPDNILESMIQAAHEISQKKHFEHFIVPAVQGGAGTSINMNVNEIIANRALQIIGKSIGDYNEIDPIEQANQYQSTNDVVPTALRVATMQLLDKLETEINELRSEFEILETKNRDILRIGYTQMQEAVPSSFGKLFSAYNDALSRDWWRISKCFERIKIVNLGGSATGTGLTVPRYVIMEAVRNLQKITNLPLTRGENLNDATSNLDSWVEIHAILKAHAVNLEKISSDIRLLASDLNTNKSLSIPQKQIGSTIMPGKVNPVISEFVISISHRVYANDQLISSLSSQGILDLNPYLPQIGDAILDSLKLLISADKSLKEHLISGININADNSERNLMSSPAITTALIPIIGYNKASLMAKYMKKENCSIFTANKNLQILESTKIEEILKPQNLLKLGFTIRDIQDL